VLACPGSQQRADLLGLASIEEMVAFVVSSHVCTMLAVMRAATKATSSRYLSADLGSGTFGPDLFLSSSA